MAKTFREKKVGWLAATLKAKVLTSQMVGLYRSTVGYSSALMLPAVFLFLVVPDLLNEPGSSKVQLAPQGTSGAVAPRNPRGPPVGQEATPITNFDADHERYLVSNNHLLPWEDEEIVIGRAIPRAKQGVSLVAACRNRQSILPRILRNWASVTGIDEVVLVDWASDEPPLADVLQKILPDDHRFRLVRVDAEPAWVLSRAYNLAFHVASHETIVRVDCDHALSENFVTHHTLQDNSTFFAGNWATARNENEVHLNGAAILQRTSFWNVVGYDERIQTYGWDDEDLYRRLCESGLRRKNLDYEFIVHIPHSDSFRAQHGVRFVEVEVDYNRLLLESLPPWNSSTSSLSIFSVRTNDIGQVVGMVSSTKVKSIEDLSTKASRRVSWDLALGRRLHDEFDIPWDLIQGMDRSNSEELLEKLMQQQANSKKKPPLFVAHVKHGLGNRLRALASAMSFSGSTNRQLIVIWEQDTHCDASFEDLFDRQQSNLVVVRNGPKWPIEGNVKYDAVWSRFIGYNYMETEGFGATKAKLVFDEQSKHIYFKSAYVIEAPGHSSWDTDNTILRSLIPCRQVLAVVNGLPSLHPERRVGVHIRNRDLEHDIAMVDSVKEYGFEAVETMEYWRKKSSYKNFMEKMDQLLAQDPTLTFFVAADSVAVLKFLCDRYPGKIAAIPRECDDRDGACMKYALADLLILGRTRLLLGSNWSSFTEAAQRFGAKDAILAGRDFAVDTERVQ